MIAGLLRKMTDSAPGQNTLDEFIEGVGALWELAIVGMAFAALLFALTIAFTKNIGWRKKRVRFVGLLFGMSGPELLWLSDRLCRQIIIVSILCLGISPGPAHILLFVGLFLVEAAMPPSFGPGRLLFAFVNNAVIFCALLVTGMLADFLRDVRGDARILLVYVLTALFVILYSLYFTLRDVSGLLERKNRPLSVSAAPDGKGGGS
jgi:hypothetical protein